MRAPYVDRLLADADGALAPIWISALFVTAALPDAAKLRAALEALVDETPRLRVAWDSAGPAWCLRVRTRSDLDAAVRSFRPTTLRLFGAALFAEPVDLAADLLVRLTVAELTDQPGHHVVALQLHHALGDARSLMFLTRRLWEHASSRLGAETRLGDPEMTDSLALREAVRRPLGLAAAALPKNRVLAARGTALRRSGKTLGAPALVSLRVPVSPDESPRRRSALFFAALLAGAACVLPKGPRGLPIRLRVPVDLRRALKLGVTLENACSAVAVEVPVSEVISACFDPERLMRIVPDRLERLVAMGAPFGTLVETVLVSRVATRAMLRDHLRPDLLADRRASTLVATYVGTVDRYCRDAPFPIVSVQTQTPTWGANGLVFDGALMINTTAFDGLWPHEEHVAFVNGMRDWFRARLGRPSEVLA